MDYPAGQIKTTPDDEQPLVSVFRAPDAIQAEIVRGTLEAEGIFAVVGEQVTGAYAGPFSVGEGAWGEILVAEVDAARAQALLADYDTSQNALNDSVDLDELTAQGRSLVRPAGLIHTIELAEQFMMGKMKRAAVGAFCGVTFALFAAGVGQTAAHAQVPYKITRASLAKTASFTVTQTLAPKDSDKLVRVYKIEVSGNNARLDYDDPSIGAVRYLANNKGVFFYIPANKSAVKQTLQGGVEGALKFAFAQVNDQLAHAKKIKTETVSGQATTVYKDAQTGTLVYLGKSPGFTLPVKTVVSNVGGTSTLLVSNIKLNVPVDAKRFALPSGTQMMDSGSSPAGAGLPAGVGGGIR